MFTGIVEQLGEVAEVTDSERGRRLTLSGDGFGSVPLGGSIAINGVCLTAAEVDGDRIIVDVVPETLRRSNLGQLRQGDGFNAERPMPASGRFDGHFVQGHVDGLGTVAAVNSDDTGTVMTVAAPPHLMRYIIEKGSITVDGVSLTVSGVSEGAFDVALIPHTLAVTTLGLRKPGDAVNLEVDVLAKYVERLLEARE